MKILTAIFFSVCALFLLALVISFLGSILAAIIYLQLHYPMSIKVGSGVIVFSLIVWVMYRFLFYEKPWN